MQIPTPLPPGGAFADPQVCGPLLERLSMELEGPLRFMEVCGTHTVSIFRSGLRSLLPDQVTHLTGPGCPVCVTHDREIAAALLLADIPGVIIATFGDLMRVPGPEGHTLKKAQAAGARVEIVYSPLDCLALAGANPDKTVCFLGVGFETTAPAVAATVQAAEKGGIQNFCVLSLHKLVPPALNALLSASGNDGDRIDGFLLPGHVSTILGLAPYRFMADRYAKPCVISGFEPADIVHSLLLINLMRREGRPDVLNQYTRAVSDAGNPKARQILFSVFEESDALWRGLGPIPRSGLSMRPEYSVFDAWKRFNLDLPDVPVIKGCRCGDVLSGRISPDQCSLFGRLCSPAEPVGPCMVSTEGSCAAYFKYQDGI